MSVVFGIYVNGFCFFVQVNTVWGHRTENKSLPEEVRDYVFRYEAQIFGALLLLPPALILVINISQSVSLYDNLMMGIAGYQAIITAYLSLKTYSVSMRDSFLPSISFNLTDVEEPRHRGMTTPV